MLLFVVSLNVGFDCLFVNFLVFLMCLIFGYVEDKYEFSIVKFMICGVFVLFLDIFIFYL